MTLTTAQRERIICHLQRGWKLPDSLVQELWEAYRELEASHVLPNALAEAGSSMPPPAPSVERGERPRP